MTEFLWPVRVYYEDTDHGGVGYYANYLKFMERARTEWLRSLGFEQDRLEQQEGVLFAVRRAEIDYIRPARFNQSLVVKSCIAEHGKASLTFEQTIYVENDDKPLCRGMIRVACLNAEKFRPSAIPENIIREMNLEQ